MSILIWGQKWNSGIRTINLMSDGCGDSNVD